MRSVQAKTRAALQSDAVNLATCWYVKVRARFLGQSQQIFMFTDHDKPIEVEDDLDPVRRSLSGTYRAGTPFRRSAVKMESNLEIGSTEIEGVSSEMEGPFRTQLRSSDLRAGVFDGADTTVFVVDVEDPTEITILIRGRINEVKVFRDGAFSLQVESWEHLLQQRVNIVTSAECRADLGDSDCRVPIRSPEWTKRGYVTAIESRTVVGAADPSYPFQVFQTSITDAPTTDGWFDLGAVYWRSGRNAGYTSEVAEGSATRVRLVYPTAYEIRVGDSFDIYPGCDKRFEGTCRGKFRNQQNFRGEPFLPGTDAVSQVGIPNRGRVYSGLAGVVVPEGDPDAGADPGVTIPPGRDDAPGPTGAPTDTSGGGR